MNHKSVRADKNSNAGEVDLPSTDETTKTFQFKKSVSNQELLLIAIVHVLEKIDNTLKRMTLKLS